MAQAQAQDQGRGSSSRPRPQLKTNPSSGPRTQEAQDVSAEHHREAAGSGLFASERLDASARRILTTWQYHRGESGRPVIIVANLGDLAGARCENICQYGLVVLFLLDLSDPESIDMTSWPEVN